MTEFLSEKQKEAWDFFRSNQKEWAANPLYKFKYMVVFDNQLVGIFDTFSAAIVDAVSKYPLGSFIIQQAVSDEDVIGFLSPDISA